MSRRITLADIAKRCGVSRMSVSQILRSPKHERYSRPTREAVLRAAAEVGYVPNRQAISLRNGKTGVIGLILPWNIPELMDRIENEVGARRHALMVQFSPLPDAEQEVRALQVALEYNVGGLIWEPITAQAFDGVPGLKALGSRLVLLGDNATGFGRPVIAFDYREGFERIFRHARQQGYRRTVFLAPSTHRIDKVRGVLAEISRAEAPGHEERLFDTKAKVLDFTPDPAAPTLFICDVDWQGLALLEIAAERGWNVPDDVGIVIMGDLLLGNEFRTGEIARIPLTALRRDFDAMAKHAVTAVFGADPVGEAVPMALFPRLSTLRRHGRVM